MIIGSYIAWLVIGFAGLQLLISFLNWAFKPQLSKRTASDFDKLVSVLIPARNEEKNISSILLDLQHQTYQNFEILVYDDLSSDKTAEIVNEFTKYDSRIRLINGMELPQGWLGKNFACQNLSNDAHGDVLVFLDADVRLEENTLEQTIQYQQSHQLKLLSVFPKQIMISAGENSVVPLMNYILLTLLPLFLVRRSGFTSLSAANGQFMLFDSQTYREIKPHEKVKNEKTEDIKIARLFKKKRLRTDCLAANDGIKCRMYAGYNESLQGFSKNIVMFFGNSYVLSFLFWLLTTFGFIVVIISMSLNWLLWLLMTIIITRVLVSLTSGQNILKNLIYIIPQQLNLGILIYKSVSAGISGNYEWKGRKIK